MSDWSVAIKTLRCRRYWWPPCVPFDRRQTRGKLAEMTGGPLHFCWSDQEGSWILTNTHVIVVKYESPPGGMG